MQIYYFTRTGRSKSIAEDLAKRHNTVANEISDGINWQGKMNFLKGGAASMKKDEVPVTFPEVSAEDEIILVFPIWAGGFPPAVRTFLKSVERERVTVVATSLGTMLKDREGFKNIIDLTGKEIETPDNV